MANTNMPATTQKSITTVDIQPNIVQLILDMPGSSANVLTSDMFRELDELLAGLQQRDDLDGIILSSAKRSVFIAGADLKQIVATLDWPDSRIIRFCEDGRAVMSRLSRMSCVTVAAIHGACVGGGLEVALWCDRRVAVADRRTILGLPEVKLGLVPGWAGTVRLPRIASLEVGLDLVTSGRVVNAQQAKEMGFVDQVSSQQQLIEDAMEQIEQARREDAFYIRRRQIEQAVPIQAADAHARQVDFLDRIRSNDAIYSYAPQVALQHMLASASLPFERACESESKAMANVYGSDPSHGLLNVFFLQEHNRKQPGFIQLTGDEKTISKVGIVGTGLMGTSIAEICLAGKLEVVLFDASDDALQAASARLQETAGDASIHVASDYSDLAGCDLVIESVVETSEIKKSVLRKIEPVVDTETVLATNTSAIPLTELASAVSQPERFCGIHFCHPHLMQLVEVVQAEASSAATMAQSVAWIRQLRKMPVVVKDSAGFVVNRLLAAMLDQTFRLYRWGYSIREIDEAMRTFGFRGGPFEIVDVIGADVCMYAGRAMWDARIECVNLSPILPRMVKKSWLGRKTGRGFYRYERIDGDRIWDDEIDNLLGSYIDRSRRLELPDDQLAESICAVITLEAAHPG